MHRFPSPLALIIAIAGCADKGQQVACTMEARPAIALVVLDSVTGASLAGRAIAIVREGDFTDTLRGIDSLVSGAHERPGTYRIVLSSPGYQEWIREGVRVERDECHVQTVKLRALLRRA